MTETDAKEEPPKPILGRLVKDKLVLFVVVGAGEGDGGGHELTPVVMSGAGQMTCASKERCERFEFPVCTAPDDCIGRSANASWSKRRKLDKEAGPQEQNGLSLSAWWSRQGASRQIWETENDPDEMAATGSWPSLAHTSAPPPRPQQEDDIGERESQRINFMAERRCGATRGSRTLCHTEMGTAMPAPVLSADVSESITVDSGSNDLSRSFSMSSSDDTNSNIMFTPGSKMAKVLIDSNGGMVTSLSKIESQFGMSTTSLDMPDMDDYQQLQQDFIACTVRTKHSCTTHPRSIAERQTTTSDKDLDYLLISGERKLGGNHGWSICELGLRSLSQIMLHCQLPAIEEPELSGMRMSSCQLADDDNKEDRLAKLLGQI
ncbi:hypothetical protein TRIUR3_21811 [Triticum urartu]|uniref:Uncharacterized protein n=1 Tax=Triticum urartu TaxID=4572 RepID=M7YZY3_TRIUA|nr:hypothetical protein TRIUR3_21811 [Triticum urartu]